MFDPFDESHRDKRSRRSSSEVEFDEKQKRERILNHFKRALEELQNPEVVDTEILKFMIENNPETNLDFLVLRRTFERSMEECGYVKLMNSKSKDGRFKIDGRFVFVYCTKNHGLLTNFDKTLMKQSLVQ